MLVGAAVVPSAPLLVPGVSAGLPDGVPKVSDAIDAALDGLPPWDTAVLIAAASRTGQSAAQGLYDLTEASLAGIGRPDVRQPLSIEHEATERIARLSQYAVRRDERLPLGLATLALLLGGAPRTVAVAVPCSAWFEALAAVGTAVAEAVSQRPGAADGEASSGSAAESPRHGGRRTIVLVAGDLSAGLTERSPLGAVAGAGDWDAQMVDIVDSGRLDQLSELGPEQAIRVGALGWAPMAVLHGAMARAKLGIVRRHYSAPCGVGYLVASGA